ncbi:hypothetical protein, partial [Sphingorhabdus sp. Alg239-R122]|uniref:hypothetical protein n=1 Tax=Sphingorhabdus sp. Alg239-R122 TaxID=2305989 RepID=UPI00196797CC
MILAIFLLAVRTERRLANALFAIFLILLAIDVSGWLIESPEFLYSWPNALRTAVTFLQMPFFTGFIAATCFAGTRLRLWHGAHALPFFGALAFTLPGDQLPFGKNGNVEYPLHYLTQDEYTLLFTALDIQYYLYIAAAIAILWQFRSVFRRHYANIRSKIFAWLAWLVAISLIAN